jgi:hypothetical protein
MPGPPENPPLKPLHPDSSLVAGKLAAFEAMGTDILIESLATGRKDGLKARPDGTILDGHHRIYVLRKRGVHVDSLPRELIERAE